MSEKVVQYGTHTPSVTEASTEALPSKNPLSPSDLEAHLVCESAGGLEEAPDLGIPDGGYGWVIVVATWIIFFSTWGSNSGYAMYLAYYLETKLFTDSVIMYAFIGGCAVGLGVAFSPFITYATGVFGLHQVLIVGLVLQLASNLLASWSVSLWQIVLSQGVLGGIALALIGIPSMMILPQWFKKKRTLATSIAGSGSGAGGIMYNLAMGRVLERYGHRWALRVQGIMCFVTIGFAICLMRVRTTIKPELKVWDRQVSQNAGALLLALFVVFAILGYVVLMYNLADFTKSLGYSSKQASIVAMMVSLGALIIRPMVGLLSDVFGTVTVNSVVHVVVGIFALAMWIPIRTYASVLVYGFIQGGLMGSVWFSVGLMVARIGGLVKFNVFFGMVWMFIGMASMASPVIGISLKSPPPPGLLVGPTQYKNVAIFVGFCYIGAGLCLWLLRGWLVARDELCTAASESDSGEEFYLTVEPLEALKGLFKRGGKLV